MEFTGPEQITMRMLLGMRTLLMTHPAIKTRKAFATIVKTSGTLIGRWENGTGNCTLDNVWRACDKLNWSAEYLIRGKGKLYGDAELQTQIDMILKRLEMCENLLNIPKDKKKK